MAVAFEAGGLVKAAREWLRLQVGQSLVPAGCACVAGARRQSVLAVRIPRSVLSASSRRRHQAAFGSTGVLLAERRGFGVGRVWLFDIQGWITLILGGLILSLPAASLLSVLGILVGISFLFSGIDLLSFSASFHPED